MSGFEYSVKNNQDNLSFFNPKAKNIVVVGMHRMVLFHVVYFIKLNNKAGDYSI